MTSETHPKIHLWMVAEGLNNMAGGRLFGVSHETVRLWRLPFADPRRRMPQNDVQIERVMQLTRGAVTAQDWYHPRLRAQPAVVGEASAPRLAVAT